MKHIFCTLLLTVLIVSCTQTNPANGFSPRETAITMGSQASVDVVIAMDKLWSEGNYEGMREMIADSAQFRWYDGKVQNTEEFIAELKSDTLSYEWSFDWAFSIKDDNPEATSEWVNAGFNGSVSDSEGTELEKALFNEWYLINDQGKITYWFNLKAER